MKPWPDSLRILVLFLAGWLGSWIGLATGFEEDFSSDPAARGWEVRGDAALFHWLPESGELGVTWDSSRPNSFFARRLPQPLTEQDDFSFGFNLQLDQVEVGFDPNKPGTFQIALGLIRLAEASAPGFQRGVFLRCTNLVEWTWFGAAQGISSSVSPVIVPADGRLPWGYRDTFLELMPGVRYGFEMAYTASDRTLRLSMTEDGEPGPELQPVRLPANFTRFQVDALSVHSYSDAGQDPRFAGSVRARGRLDAIHWTVPPDPVGRVQWVHEPERTGLRVESRQGWTYRVEVSGDWTHWVVVGGPLAGSGQSLVLPVPGPASGTEAQFYRVRAERP
jgi:hypothetical protein